MVRVLRQAKAASRLWRRGISHASALDCNLLLAPLVFSFADGPAVSASSASFAEQMIQQVVVVVVVAASFALSHYSKAISQR